MIDFSPPFNCYFTVRPTAESYNYPLKVLTEGSMVEYLPVGSQEAPKTIFGQKKSNPKVLNHTRPLCTVTFRIQRSSRPQKASQNPARTSRASQKLRTYNSAEIRR